MAKMTRKYKQALYAAFAPVLNKDSLFIPDRLTQDELYQKLIEVGFMWDSKKGEWVHLNEEAADLPSDLIMVRVWADAEIVSDIADMVIRGIKHHQLVERSLPYPCRPPKQLESRIYLKFLK